MQKGSALIFVLVGVLVVAAIGGVVYLNKSPQKPSSPSSVTTSSTAVVSHEPTGSDETSDWKTFSDTKFGFEVKYPPVFQQMQKTTKLDYDGMNLASFFTAKDQNGLEANSLDINIYPNLMEYRLVDNAGGVIFRFDIDSKNWLHDKTNDVSEFIPNKIKGSIEAYLYKTGDVKCRQELILIPNPYYQYLVEIIHGLCRDDDGNYIAGYYDLKPTQILSTFNFLE